MGESGIEKATEYAILNANYMKARLKNIIKFYIPERMAPVHMNLLLTCGLLKTAQVLKQKMLPKGLMDYGFHAPTLSFPVAGTIMIEPTESEDKAELDRFCDAMINIYEEIKSIEKGKLIKKIMF